MEPPPPKPPPPKTAPARNRPPPKPPPPKTRPCQTSQQPFTQPRQKPFQETLDYFANPDNINSDALPPGLDTWDPAPYLACAAPIFASLLGVNFLHEVGHRIAAKVRGVKLGPTYFIPNLQIGSFGAITPIASLLKGRRDLWDVAAAGPIAGGLASLALVGLGLCLFADRRGGGHAAACARTARRRQCQLTSLTWVLTPAPLPSPSHPKQPPRPGAQLFIGLQQSQGGGLPQELLVPVPTQLFQARLASSPSVWCCCVAGGFGTARRLSKRGPLPFVKCRSLPPLPGPPRGLVWRLHCRPEPRPALTPPPPPPPRPPSAQGSLLLGSAARFALGEAAMARTEVLISPLVIAGWCGLVTTALNLLPVGNLDGGRMMQAAFGGQALSLSSFFVYVGLGLGLLGSSLSLPFGLYVLICQRNAEKYIKDSVTGVATEKQIATAAAVLTAILILVPLAPEFAQQMGVGPANNLFM